MDLQFEEMLRFKGNSIYYSPKFFSFYTLKSHSLKVWLSVKVRCSRTCTKINIGKIRVDEPTKVFKCTNISTKIDTRYVQ